MRLIDADAFLKRNEVYADCEFIHPMYQNTLREIVDDEPTIPAPRWVRCEERLPDDGDTVLIYCETTGGIVKSHFREIDGRTGKIILFSGGTHHPTHWMPLPEPPKEDA